MLKRQMYGRAKLDLLEKRPALTHFLNHQKWPRTEMPRNTQHAVVMGTKSRFLSCQWIFILPLRLLLSAYFLSFAEASEACLIQEKVCLIPRFSHKGILSDLS